MADTVDSGTVSPYHSRFNRVGKLEGELRETVKRLVAGWGSTLRPGPEMDVAWGQIHRFLGTGGDRPVYWDTKLRDGTVFWEG